MLNTQNRNLFSGVVIRVQNLETCRSFYRDVLNLGVPVLDSNFWVEFRINGNTSLYLEKAECGEKIAAPNSRIAWMLHVKDLKAFEENMEKYGYHGNTDSADRIGFPVRYFQDPEGNGFYVAEIK